MAIYDHHSGDSVCTECAHVLSERMPPESESRSETVSIKLDSHVADIGANGNYTSGITSTAADIYECLRKEMTFRFTPRRHLVAYSFYESCFVHEAPRTMTEISSLTGVAMRYLWKIETRRSSHLKRCFPEDIVERFASMLGFTYTQIIPMKMILTRISGEEQYQGRSARTLVAAVIWNHIKREGLVRSKRSEFTDVLGIQPCNLSRICMSICST
jgi:transcription initiation factor TFIIIB Brf1 subunit/transcription initiation factor TFIIB